jgi:hypothetical protein
LFALASEAGIKRVGRIDVDSTKIRADVSSESVIKSNEFARFKQVLVQILKEAEELDNLEESEGYAGQTVLEKPVGTDQMREIIRRVRSSCEQDSPIDTSKLKLGSRMLRRVGLAVDALGAAEENGQKHISLTDPDAQMMGEGRNKKIQECHSFEVAADNGLLVAAGTTQSAADNDRLIDIVAQADQNEPDGVTEVVADCGYYRGDVLRTLEDSGIATCVPDPYTACDVRKGLRIGNTRSRSLNKVPLEYDSSDNCYRCPAGNELHFVGTQRKGDETFRKYVALTPCSDCKLKAQCLQNPKATKRMVRSGDREEQNQALLTRFNTNEHKQRYHDRGKNVETVFAFLRSVLHIHRWMVRGAKKVAAEATLMAAGYQIRKVHTAIMAASG